MTREGINAYVRTVGESESAYGDIAPPMFAVVYAGAALAAGLFDPALAIDFAHLVHGSQEFTWPGPVVRAGDVVGTVLTLSSIRATAGLTFYVFDTTSTNGRGELVAAGTWTNIVRGDG